MTDLIIPGHVGVILDGNRRWAVKNGMKAWEGHKYGSDTFDKFLNWCLELNVQEITAYVLSSENITRRPKKEVIELLRLLKEHLDKYETEKAGLLDKYEVKVRFCGELHRLPKPLIKVMNRIMKRTEKYQKRFLNIAIAYGSRFELLGVMKKIAKKVLKTGRIQITEKTIQENLLISGNVDLVIRTGGQHRLSNFVLWQSAYAELFVTETLWPDFSKRELMKAIRWFSERKRNFGK